MDALAQCRAEAQRRFYAKRVGSSLSVDSAATPAPSTEAGPSKLTGEEPSEKAAIAEHMGSAEFAELLEILTASGRGVRGCQVDPARHKLQALHDVVGWTPGGYTTRPSPEAQDRKRDDRLQVLTNYRQPDPEPGQPPIVAMYDYICHTLFDVPVRPVGPEVRVPQMKTLQGDIVTPQWVECDWAQFTASRAGRPTKVLRPNRYPYQLRPRRTGSSADAGHELQTNTQHWILWYFHGPCDPLPSPADAEIDSDVCTELFKVVTAAGFDRFDYIWYHNPGISVPDVYHVQVFWLVT
ncbi:unnamed protein product [Prorocentrum cordatum]|uniref:Uncharacterized protein n=1 Tax=Prorocentrum cordatum TaxID=2364126 RepID=A0ABN9WA15_9DINO|nr:unnamed protein product [Polarella glacialis]